MEQRLVSVFLTTESDADRDPCEHLSDYLEAGWRVVDFKPLNGSGAGGSETMAGWIVVLLERELPSE
jgi:hypothetical protein